MVAELGYRSHSDALRAMIRVGSGFLEFSREDAEARSAVQHELHKIGVNVNQIALAASRRRVALVQTQWQDLNELPAVLPSALPRLCLARSLLHGLRVAWVGPPAGQGLGRWCRIFASGADDVAEVDDIVADYGQLIVDECHHLSASSFELVAGRSKARYVAGLSATVTRKDGQHPIIFMQCGAAPYTIKFMPGSQAVESGIRHCARASQPVQTA